MKSRLVQTDHGREVLLKAPVAGSMKAMESKKNALMRLTSRKFTLDFAFKDNSWAVSLFFLFNCKNHHNVSQSIY